ncbi:hypothetical protein GCK32_011484 [Trichostrongylus colubriformis]|uniref:Uncharacterized protein n=1 Tax=Trichostrongylus colubriformis TaxID=6319 RepID=A0AAN8FUL1_TRICO
MDVFKIVVQLASSAIVVSAVPCGKKKDAHKMKFAKGSKSLSASRSSTISKSLEVEKTHSKEKHGKPKGNLKPQAATKKEEPKEGSFGKFSSFSLCFYKVRQFGEVVKAR